MASRATRAAQLCTIIPTQPEYEGLGKERNISRRHVPEGAFARGSTLGTIQLEVLSLSLGLHNSSSITSSRYLVVVYFMLCKNTVHTYIPRYGRQVGVLLPEPPSHTILV